MNALPNLTVEVPEISTFLSCIHSDDKCRKKARISLFLSGFYQLTVIQGENSMEKTILLLPDVPQCLPNDGESLEPPSLTST